MVVRRFGLLLVLVTIGVLPVPFWASAQEGEGNEESVNVEFILDVSGSMAEVLPTGETRMDAAKRVMGSVIEALPAREGINVGFRIYGHEGDNTEAGKAVSCQSTELVVPLKGVDKPALREQLNALQPTGWTPIALSLSRASDDFTEQGEGVVNAIVLITDGLETCDEDPCATAGRLRGYQRAITTHVVGFALTAEEQETLGCIAENGGGLLLGAGNAEELNTALFSVLEQLDIVAGPGFVGGNAFSLLPAGESGEVSVVAVGILDQIGNLPFVLRNNTTEDVGDIKVTVSARDAAGQLVGAADALTVHPHHVVAGGVAFGAAYFGNVSLPPDVTFELDVQATPIDDMRFPSIFRDLSVVEASLFEDRIVGQMENQHEDPVTGAVSLSAVCFDLNGALVGQIGGIAGANEVAPGDTQPFQLELTLLTFQGFGCPAFLVAGSGIKG